MTGPVVVGIDDSVQSGYALAWAAREARLRGARLHIVVATLDDTGPRSWSAELLEKITAHERTAAPDLQIDSDLVEGRAVPVLASLAEHATMIVVGSRGSGGFAGLLLGSVAHHLTQVAACPVITVPSPELPVANRVVVGVDGTQDNEAAIEFAFAEADLRGAELRAVLSWSAPVSSGPGDLIPLVYDLDDAQADESRVLAEALAGLRQARPDVAVDAQAVRGHPVRVLADRASDAVLLVVGRHAGGRVSAAVGSVAHGVLHHATCPVAVVPS